MKTTKKKHKRTLLKKMFPLRRWKKNNSFQKYLQENKPFKKK